MTERAERSRGTRLGRVAFVAQPRPSPDGDGAQIQVLEAVLIAVILFGAVGFVLTFTLPTSDTAPERAGLEQRAEDALAVLNELGVEDGRYGNNLLSYAVSKALEGDPSMLEARLEGLLPPATRFYVSMSNGVDHYEVYNKSGKARGETVTASHVLEPQWTYTFVAKDAGNYAAPNTLGVYALPVYNSNPTDDGGVPVEVTVEFSQGGRQWTTRSVYSTVQGATEGGLSVASNVYGADALGNPKPFYDRTAIADNVVNVVVRADGDAPIPAGTTLQVRLPPGLTGATWGLPDGAGMQNGPVGWTTAVENVTGFAGGVLEASPTTPIAAGSQRMFRFYANDTGAWPYMFHVLDVTLGGTRWGKAEIVLQDNAHVTFTGGDYVDVFASVPKPMGSDETTTWGVVVANPPMQPDPLDPVRIERVRIRQPDGIALFDTDDADQTTSISPDGTEFEVDEGGAALVWTGPWDFADAGGAPTYTATTFVLRVKGAGTETRHEARDYLEVPITVTSALGDHVFHLTRRVEPGLFYGQIPPGDGLTYPGYTAAIADDNPIDADVSYHGAALPGSWQYDAGQVPYKEILSSATTEVSPRAAPIGSPADIHVNVENLLAELLFRGFSVNTVTRVYAPWSMDDHVTVFEKVSEATTTERRDVTDVEAVDITGDGWKDLVVGTNHGKLVGFDVAKDGAVISGHTRAWTGQSVLAIEPLVLDDHEYLVVGLGFDTSKTDSLRTLLLLDGENNFEDHLDAFAFDGGFFDVGDVAAGLDLDSDGAPDYLAGDAQGTSSAMSGEIVRQRAEPGAPDPTDQDEVSSAWPKSHTARSSLVEFGTSGPGPEPTAIVTTGVDANGGVWRTADYTESTNSGEMATELVELVKSVYISTSTDGLIGYNAEGEEIWRFPAGGFRVVSAVDLDEGDAPGATTDVVAGTWDGYVYAVNGTQAAMPWMGMIIASGDQITDSDFVDANVGITVNAEGTIMSTRDGFTTRDYPDGIPVTAVGAQGVDLIDAEDGFIVGKSNVVWKVEQGGRTAAPYTDWTIKDPVPILGIYTTLYPAGAWGANDFLDVEFNGASNGIIVGTTCGAYCAANGGALPIYTTDGGATWWPGSFDTGTPVTSLDKVHFVDATHAFAVGPKWVYTSTGAPPALPTGKVWTAIAKPDDLPADFDPLFDNFRNIHCTSATHCWVVGDRGKIWELESVGAVWVWRAEASGVSADLKDVAFHGDDGIAVGEQTTVLRTRDGGETWVLQPGAGPLIADFNTVDYPDEEIAYFFGGNTTSRSYGTTASFESTATAQTIPLFDLGDYAYMESPRITSVHLDPVSSTNEFTNIVYEYSFDEGATWSTFEPKDPTELELLGKRQYLWRELATNPTSLTLRFTLTASLEGIFHTPIVRDVDVDYNRTFTCKAGFDIVAVCEAGVGGGGPATCDVGTRVCTGTTSVDAGIASGETKEASKTTAEWVAVGGGAMEIRLPRVHKFWTAYVEGKVNALDASRDVNGDGVKDVVVAVGAREVTADVAAARVDEVTVFDGASGAVVATRSFDLGEGALPTSDVAEPWRVRFADVGTLADAREGIPEVVLTVFEHVQSQTTGTAHVYVLNATTLLDIDSWTLSGRPDVLDVADIDGTDGDARDDFIVGTGAVGQTPGFVYVYSAVNKAAGAGAWTRLAQVSPEIGGRYVITWDVPEGTPYGPYVAETEITWEEEDTGTVQSLFLVDYFTVTPKSGEPVVRPVYTVHLVTWFDDWDFGGGD